jgi:hypothetical protein
MEGKRLFLEGEEMEGKRLFLEGEEMEGKRLSLKGEEMEGKRLSLEGEEIMVEGKACALLLQNEKYAHKGLHYPRIFLKPVKGCSGRAIALLMAGSMN